MKMRGGFHSHVIRPGEGGLQNKKTTTNVERGREREREKEREREGGIHI